MKKRKIIHYVEVNGGRFKGLDKDDYVSKFKKAITGKTCNAWTIQKGCTWMFNIGQFQGGECLIPVLSKFARQVNNTATVISLVIGTEAF